MTTIVKMVMTKANCLGDLDMKILRYVLVRVIVPQMLSSASNIYS